MESPSSDPPMNNIGEEKGNENQKSATSKKFKGFMASANGVSFSKMKARATATSEKMSGAVQVLATKTKDVATMTKEKTKDVAAKTKDVVKQATTAYAGQQLQQQQNHLTIDVEDNQVTDEEVIPQDAIYETPIKIAEAAPAEAADYDEISAITTPTLVDDQTTNKKRIDSIVSSAKTMVVDAKAAAKTVALKGKGVMEKISAETTTSTRQLIKPEESEITTMATSPTSSADQIDIAADGTMLSKTMSWSKSTARMTKKGLSNIGTKMDLATIGTKMDLANIGTKIDPRNLRKKKKEDADSPEANESDTGARSPEQQWDSSVQKIDVSPILEYLLHDVAIAIGLVLLFAFTPTLRHLGSIIRNQIPSNIAFMWILSAFYIGYEVGRWNGTRKVPVYGAKNTIVLEDDNHGDGEPQAVTRPLTKEGYILIVWLMKPFAVIRLNFLTKASEISTTVDEKQPFWSTLSKTSGSRENWETVGFVQVADPLMDRLKRYKDFQRKSLQDAVSEAEIIVSGKPIGATNETDDAEVTRVGTIDISKMNATALEAGVIVPSFTLRGIDCFATDTPEDELYAHPVLLDQGLRSKPTLLVNSMMSWSNMLIYFQLPDWIEDWDKSLEEHEDDQPDVKAIKRFFKGDDEYRKRRLKILPYLVDGPMTIRLLAPQKKEMTITCNSLRTKWRFHPKEVQDGRDLMPLVELEIDVSTSKSSRNASSMARRYMKSISLDLAAIIEKPGDQEQAEPTACLGLWRVAHLDPDRCPGLPPRVGDATNLEQTLDAVASSSTIGDEIEIKEMSEGIKEE